MTIEIENRSGSLAPTDQLHSLLTYCLTKLELNPEDDLTVIFVDEAEMEELHIKWMDEPGPTDVLSFPMDEVRRGSAKDAPAILGDIILCPSVAEDQAKKAGHSPNHEIFILTAHGLLHLLGYDHAEKAEEIEMFSLQEELVANWQKL
ncbi:MAG: rRNA maturation RNase YbeY [Actinomycetes bacterium]